MPNPKSKKTLLSRLQINDYLIIILIFVILVNIITRLNSNDKNLIKYQFALIEENINTYKASVNSNIIEKLSVLTNVLNSTTIISNIYPLIIKKIQTDKIFNSKNKFENSLNINNDLSDDSSNNKLNYVFDNVFSVKDKLYIQIGNFYYKEGDTLNGKNIDSISPSFVVIDGQYYPVLKDKKK
jgi:hypothetical protein